MQITIDISGWTQTEKNYLQAAAVALLYAYDNKYDGHGIIASGNVITIDDSINPPADIANILSSTNLKAWIDTELELIRISTEAARAEQALKDAEVLSSEFQNIKLADVDAKIDSIQNLAQMKLLMKKLVRFLVARM